MNGDRVWEEDWTQELKRKAAVIAVLALLASGGIMLLTHGKNFLVAVKPAYDMEYVMTNGAKEGMHISGEITVVYDCFAEMENTQNKKITAYYYAVPAGEGMAVLQVSAGMQHAADRLLEETINYMNTGMVPSSSIPIEGYVVKAEGRIPYLLSEYMKEIGYSQEEIEAMGEPLMLRDTAGGLGAARIYAPLGMILLALGILATMFAIFRERFRRGTER